MGLATIGRFDGKNPGMACVTAGGRVLIHQPYINSNPQDPFGMKKGLMKQEQ